VNHIWPVEQICRGKGRSDYRIWSYKGQRELRSGEKNTKAGYWWGHRNGWFRTFDSLMLDVEDIVLELKYNVVSHSVLKV